MDPFEQKYSQTLLSLRGYVSPNGGPYIRDLKVKRVENHWSMFVGTLGAQINPLLTAGPFGSAL